jgi:hypothetical protein
VKHQTQISLDVELTFEVLEPMDVNGITLPPMIDIQAAYASLERPDGKVSRVNILKVLSESQRILLEDQIIEELAEQDDYDDGDFE